MSAASVGTVAPGKTLWKILLPAGMVILLIGGVLYFRSTRPAKLTEKDTVVLADFSNTTGDPVFDGTLKQALAVDLNQSPLRAQAQVQKTLTCMGRSPDERLTTDLARDLCLRVGSKAMLSGSIASLRTQYIITLTAVNCQSGDSLAQQQVEASSKEQVLSTLGSSVSKLRGTLGESLASVQKFDVPIEQLTTASLDALKAFALGNAEFDYGREMAALPFYRRAVELDPNFAWVYARMATICNNQGESEAGKEYIRKAYELRDRVSETCVVWPIFRPSKVRRQWQSSKKYLDHKTAFGPSPYVSLVQLGLARGYAMSGDSAKARIAYQDFFTEWKDADPDIPILKEAKVEYANLQ